MPVLYLSRYIIGHKLECYPVVIEVTRNEAWEPWILFMLAAVRDTSRWTLAKIESMTESGRLDGGNGPE